MTADPLDEILKDTPFRLKTEPFSGIPPEQQPWAGAPEANPHGKSAIKAEIARLVALL